MPPPLRVLIADDEPLVREALRGALVADPRADVVGECGDGLAALEACDELHPDVVFLDVEMPILTGLEVATQLEANERPAIVFVTADDPYAVRAFELDSIDYLVKPFDDNRVRDTLRHAVERRAAQARTGARAAERTIRLESTLGDLARHTHTPVRFVATIADAPIAERRMRVVDAAAVDWIERADDCVRVHTGHDSALIRQPMSAIEDRLDPAEFARVNAATIVRLSRIRELAPTDSGDYKLFLVTGATLMLGHAYRDRVISRLKDG
jgi:two-component system, LytTR family, response regulator